MSLSFRPAQPADLRRCQALLQSHVPVIYTPQVWAAMPALWARLCAERRLKIHVFEDTARPVAQKIFCMASGVFVTPEFSARLLSDRRAFLADEIYRRELAGEPVILARTDVARSNTGQGVDVVGLDYAVESLRWSDFAGLRLLPLITESMRAWIGGYRLRSMHRELFEPALHLMARAAGWRRRNPTVDAPRGASSLRGLRPALYGLTLSEALTAPGSAASLHFLYTEPTLRFTPAQQELLLLALLGQSDLESANSLKKSLGTIKKQWQAVFEWVSRMPPDWIPPDVVGSDDGKRGVEKRRRLLQYLRQHLEELRSV